MTTSPSLQRPFLSGEADLGYITSTSRASSLSLVEEIHSSHGLSQTRNDSNNDRGKNQISKKPLIQIIVDKPATSNNGVDSKASAKFEMDENKEGPPPIYFQESIINEEKEPLAANSDDDSDDKSRKTQDHFNQMSSSTEQMMKDAIKAKKEKENQSIEKMKKQLKKTSFGMKKGFLNSSINKSQKSKKTKTKPKVKSTHISHVPDIIYEVDGKGNIHPSKDGAQSIPTIRPKQSKSNIGESPLRFQEVQDAMKDNSNLSNYISNHEQEWNTPDLMDQISNNKVLSSGMTNPKFTAALEAFKSNPKSTMKQFQNHPDIIEFLNEFCLVMGNHFTELGEKKGGRKKDTDIIESLGPLAAEALQREKEDKKKGETSWDTNLSNDERSQLDTIMADQELTSLLMDVDLQRIMSECATQAGCMRMYMQHERYGPKLRKLIKAGLLKVV